jgi:hypothetical protein
MPYILQRVLHSNVGEELLSVEIKNRCKYRRTRSYVAHFTPCFRPTRHSLICNFWMTKTDKLRPFVNTLIASWLVLPLRYLPLDNSNILYYQRSSYSAKSAFGTYLYYTRGEDFALPPRSLFSPVSVVVRHAAVSEWSWSVLCCLGGINLVLYKIICL